MKVIADYSEGRDNNFNLIRMVAAVMVLFNHSFDLLGLNGHEPLTWLIGVPSSVVGVNVFFIISGFLVAGSYSRSRNLLVYLESRFLRIFPGLVACVLFCAFVLGGLLTSLPLAHYYARNEIWEYVLINSTLLLDKIRLRYILPGVFAGNPYPDIVNGSLWTLPYEVWLYVFLAVVGICGVLRKRKAANVLFLAIVECDMIILALMGGGNPNLFGFSDFARFSMYFSIGAVLFVNRYAIPLHRVLFGLAFAATLVAWRTPLAEAVFPLALAYSILWLAYVPSGLIRAYNGLGDFSYGMYIYAFPIQQALISRVPGLEPIQLFSLALPVTFIFAAVSWHAIEKRALARKGAFLRSVVRVRSST